VGRRRLCASGIDRRGDTFGYDSGDIWLEGSAGTVAWVDRVTGVYAVLMTQYMPSSAYSFHADFTTAIFADLSNH